MCALTFFFASAPSARPRDQVRDYFRALDLYRLGEYSEAIETVLALAPDVLKDSVNAVADADLRVKDTRRLNVAAVMLLDSAATLFLRKDWRFSEKHGLAVGVVHRLNTIGAQDRAVRDWYLLEDALLEGAADFRFLRSQLADAREFFPKDAFILMASGSALETDGRNLDDAAKFYRASLAIDGSNAECRLRLARTLARLGKPTESLAELDRLQSATDDRIAYLRELFRASALAALGSPSAAEAGFIGALQWNTQAPYLGLAQSLSARGEDEAARKVIARLFAANVPEEPWTAYQRGQWPHFHERLADARRNLK